MGGISQLGPVQLCSAMQNPLVFWNDVNGYDVPWAYAGIKSRFLIIILGLVLLLEVFTGFPDSPGNLYLTQLGQPTNLKNPFKEKHSL